MTTTVQEAPEPKAKRKKPKGKYPARNWTYGARAPYVNLTRVNDEIWKAHKLRNDCVASENTRREAIAARLRELVPELEGLETAADAAWRAFYAFEDEVALRNAQARARTATAADKAQAKTLRAAAIAASGQVRDCKRPIYASEAFKATDGVLMQAHKDRCYAAYKASGIYWGTRAAVQKSLEVKGGRAPKFHKWDGAGCVMMQIQAVYCNDADGLTVEEAFAGVNGFLQLRMTPTPPGRSPKSGRVVIARVRIGMENNEPIWTEMHMTMHRPFPEGCRIKEVYIDKWRTGTKDRWQVRFGIVYPTAVFPDGVPTPQSALGPIKAEIPQSNHARIGIDVGWRLRPDRSLRVAAWQSELPIDVEAVRRYAHDLGVPPWVDETGCRGELVLPESLPPGTSRKRPQPPKVRGWSGWFKCDSLQSIRDRNFNGFLPQVVAWKQQAQFLPEWFMLRTDTLPLWRSCNRLAGLSLFWEKNRFPGDEAIFPLVLAWQRQDRHLYDWAECQRSRLQNWRAHVYRCFAASLRRSFWVASIESTDWSHMQKGRGPIHTTQAIEAIVKMRKIASVGKLLLSIREAIKCEEHAPEFTTQRCHACGRIERFNVKDVNHTCSHCGEFWDQDDNAARILKAIGNQEMEPATLSA